MNQHLKKKIVLNFNSLLHSCQAEAESSVPLPLFLTSKTLYSVDSYMTDLYVSFGLKNVRVCT